MQRNGVVIQAAARAVMDRQVLNGVGVAILEAAVMEPLRRDVPAAADRGEGVGRRPAAFFEAIERERAAIAGRDRRSAPRRGNRPVVV